MGQCGVTIFMEHGISVPQCDRMVRSWRCQITTRALEVSRICLLLVMPYSNMAVIFHMSYMVYMLRGYRLKSTEQQLEPEIMDVYLVLGNASTGHFLWNSVLQCDRMIRTGQMLIPNSRLSATAIISVLLLWTSTVSAITCVLLRL